MDRCQIKISRGKNKGKICGHVHETCRHRENTCHRCGTFFTHSVSYALHLSQCGKVEADTESTGHAVIDVQPVSRPERERERERVERTERERIKCEVKPKSERYNLNGGQPHPHTIIVNQITVTDCVFNIAAPPMKISNNFYTELIAKMGKDAALQFITQTAEDKTPVEIFKKLYIDGVEPNERPIANCGNRHFRFNTEGGLVDDTTGAGLNKLIRNHIQNTYLQSSNDIISKQVESSDEMEDDRFVKWAKVQTAATDMICVDVGAELAPITYNLNHPFWEGPLALAARTARVDDTASVCAIVMPSS